MSISVSKQSNLTFGSYLFVRPAVAERLARNTPNTQEAVHIAKEWSNIGKKLKTQSHYDGLILDIDDMSQECGKLTYVKEDDTPIEDSLISNIKNFTPDTIIKFFDRMREQHSPDVALRQRVSEIYKAAGDAIKDKVV